MEDKTPYYATVAYDSIHAPELKKLCKKLQITQKEFIPLAVEFFLKADLDPRDKLEEVKSDFRTVVKTSENRLIGFIKTQDKTNAEEFARINEQLEASNRNIQRLINIMSQ